MQSLIRILVKEIFHAMSFFAPTVGRSALRRATFLLSSFAEEKIKGSSSSHLKQFSTPVLPLSPAFLFAAVYASGYSSAPGRLRNQSGCQSVLFHAICMIKSGTGPNAPLQV
jgi:hypothetical protein